MEAIITVVLESEDLAMMEETIGSWLRIMAYEKINRFMGN